MKRLQAVDPPLLQVPAVAAVALATGIACGVFRAEAKMTVLVVVGVLGAVLGLLVVTQQGLARLLFLMMAASSFLTPMNGLRVGSWMALSDIFLFLAMALAAATVVTRPSPPGDRRLFRAFLGYLTLIAVGGLVASLSSSDHPAATLPDLGRFAISTLGVLSLLAAWRPDRRTLRTLLWLFALGGAVSVVAGLISGFTFVGRAVGLTPHPNHLGMVSLLASGSSFGLALASRGIARRFALALFLVLVLGVVISGSRAAVVGEAAMLALVTLGVRRLTVVRYAIVLPTIFVVLAVAGAAPVPSSNAFARLTGSDPSGQPSDIARAEFRRETIDLIKKHPITGAGFELSRSAHSIYLQVWVSAGLLGLLGMLLIVRRTADTLLRTSSSDAVLASVAASVAAFQITGVASNILWDRYVWLQVGMMLALASTADQASSRAPSLAATSRTA